MIPTRSELVAGLMVVSLGLGPAAVAAEPKEAQVEIEEVEVQFTQHGPVVLLKAEERMIPIFVDPTVAGSIQGALSGEKFRRPLSHDLMHTILKTFGAAVVKTEITLKDGIFYADLTVSLNGDTKVFDSRSSDAIAMAIHFKAPIFVGRELLQSAGKPIGESVEEPKITL